MTMDHGISRQITARVKFTSPLSSAFSTLSKIDGDNVPSDQVNSDFRTEAWNGSPNDSTNDVYATAGQQQLYFEGVPSAMNPGLFVRGILHYDRNLTTYNLPLQTVYNSSIAGFPNYGQPWQQGYAQTSGHCQPTDYEGSLLRVRLS